MHFVWPTCNACVVNEQVQLILVLLDFLKDFVDGILRGDITLDGNHFAVAMSLGRLLKRFHSPTSDIDLSGSMRRCNGYKSNV